MSVLVTMDVIQLWDKYDQDFGLLEEPWADKEDYHKFTSEALYTLAQYWNLCHEVKVKAYSDELRAKIQNQIDDLSSKISIEALEELHSRLNNL